MTIAEPPSYRPDPEPLAPARPERPDIPLLDLLDRLLGTGVALSGDVVVSLAGVDLVQVRLRALISSVRSGMVPPMAAGTHASPSSVLPQRLETDSESVERDLFKLVLTIVELIRQLMEKQALRRVDDGDLTEEQLDALGDGLMQLEQAMDELKYRFDLTTTDLNIDLGPLGTLLSE